jgi:hypothetical protein
LVQKVANKVNIARNPASVGEKITTSSANMSINKFKLSRLTIVLPKDLVRPTRAFLTKVYTRSKNKAKSRGLHGHPYFNPNNTGIIVNKGSDLICAARFT